MFQIIQEAALPLLSQTSLYGRFNQTSNISKHVAEEISTMKEHMVKPDDLAEIISLMKLNGDPIVKKAIRYYQANKIIIIDNKETSKIPSTLPFITVTGKTGNMYTCIFADKIVTKIQSQNEFRNLMAVMEAAYLAQRLQQNPNMFIMNRQLMLTLCDVYVRMATAPLESKLYMKGDNLIKAMMYIITYFYRMIDGVDKLDPSRIPFKRLIANTIDDSIVRQIVKEVRELPDNSFMRVLGLIKQINPVRYKDLENLYITYFTSTCGLSLIFALENLSYLFLLLTSSYYRTTVTAFAINKTVSSSARKALTVLSSIEGL